MFQLRNIFCLKISGEGYAPPLNLSVGAKVLPPPPCIRPCRMCLLYKSKKSSKSFGWSLAHLNLHENIFLFAKMIFRLLFWNPNMFIYTNLNNRTASKCAFKKISIIQKQLILQNFYFQNFVILLASVIEVPYQYERQKKYKLGLNQLKINLKVSSLNRSSNFNLI